MSSKQRGFCLIVCGRPCQGLSTSNAVNLAAVLQPDVRFTLARVVTSLVTVNTMERYQLDYHLALLSRGAPHLRRKLVQMLWLLEGCRQLFASIYVTVLYAANHVR